MLADGEFSRCLFSDIFFFPENYSSSYKGLFQLKVDYFSYFSIKP